MRGATGSPTSTWSRVVESWIQELPESADRVIVDPPRAGLAMEVRKTLLAKRPKRLTYVSCHPATLARDLRLLKTVFALEKVTLIDLFPQTGHMETVVQMVRREGEGDGADSVNHPARHAEP